MQLADGTFLRFQLPKDLESVGWVFSSVVGCMPRECKSLGCLQHRKGEEREGWREGNGEREGERKKGMGERRQEQATACIVHANGTIKNQVLAQSSDAIVNFVPTVALDCTIAQMH